MRLLFSFLAEVVEVAEVALAGQVAAAVVDLGVLVAADLVVVVPAEAGNDHPPLSLTFI